MEPPSEELVAAAAAALERCLPLASARSLAVLVFNLAKLCRQHDAGHPQHAMRLIAHVHPVLEQVRQLQLLAF